MSGERIRVGLAGLGYWGPNLARNMDAMPGAHLSWICDGSPERLEAAKGRFTDARATGLGKSIRSLCERSACQDFNGGVPEERFACANFRLDAWPSRRRRRS